MRALRSMSSKYHTHLVIARTNITDVLCYTRQTMARWMVEVSIVFRPLNKLSGLAICIFI